MDMSIWFLLGAVLVFFMQAGFAMVEAGFTRAKNAGNIIMKNMADFCVGAVAFTLLGYSIMCAEDYVLGFIGVPNLDIFANWGTDAFDSADFIFNLVFCATAATIVSGAMAERTRFAAYVAYSAVISLVIYPIEAGWVWNGSGWLAEAGFLDFAGSSAIHMVGGIMAFIGAAMLGPRIGKYALTSEGKKVSKAIPGHSLTIGALGVFILWFGWYGFNGAAAGDAVELASILVTTTLAAALAGLTTLIFTWVKGGKPDVSMTLNGALGGLVGITAPCANVNALGAIVIGIVAGLLIPISVEFIDKVLHVDDPVGAVAVHGVCGIWGTLAVGLFAIDGVGLFYGGGPGQLGIQALGVAAIFGWTAVTMTIVFFLINKTIGLRANTEDELQGLDISEHGLVSAYADFLAAPDTSSYYVDAVAPATVTADVDVDEAVPVVNKTTPGGDKKFTKVEIITRPQMLEALKLALEDIGATGMTVTNVVGHGLQKGQVGSYRGVAVDAPFVPKIKVETVVSLVPVSDIIDTAKKVLYTGTIGDGKIFVTDVENAVKIRTGEEGYDALQDYAE